MNLVDLNDDAALLIIRHLAVQDRIHLAQTCKRFYHLVNDPAAWPVIIQSFAAVDGLDKLKGEKNHLFPSSIGFSLSG